MEPPSGPPWATSSTTVPDARLLEHGNSVQLNPFENLPFRQRPQPLPNIAQPPFYLSDLPGLSRLPAEILRQISAYLLTLPRAIHFYGTTMVAIGEYQNLDRIITLMGICPAGPEIFYANNTFYMLAPSIPTFLAYNNVQSYGETPKNYITHLTICIRTYMLDYDKIARQLGRLLFCPRLKKLDLDISLCYGEWPRSNRLFFLFYRIKAACIELGAKLNGDVGLKVELNWIGLRERWTMANFQRGSPPGWCNRGCNVLGLQG
ncbi:MAG: hypothetical protein Q9168_002077 [Polycauliona sp. 1 TL-2023]